MKKTLSNTGEKLKNKVPVMGFGNPMKWVCICKAWHELEGWMKSTKVMQLPSGCLVQVSTQQGDNVAESLVYVPGVVIDDFQ